MIILGQGHGGGCPPPLPLSSTAGPPPPPPPLLVHIPSLRPPSAASAAEAEHSPCGKQLPGWLLARVDIAASPSCSISLNLFTRDGQTYDRNYLLIIFIYLFKPMKLFIYIYITNVIHISKFLFLISYEKYTILKDLFFLFRSLSLTRRGKVSMALMS